MSANNVVGSVPGADETGALGTGFGAPSTGNTEAHEGSNPSLPISEQYTADDPPPWINRYRFGPNQWPGV